MDYKEKYEAIVNRAKYAYGSGAYDDKTMEFLIPELTESEDERIRKAIVLGIERCAEAGSIFGFVINDEGVNYHDVITYLEKQKEQKPVEWSEEDKELLDFWLDVIDRNDWRMDENFCKASREFINRLKSLRSRPKSSDNWKPSKEQMKALLSKLPVIKGGGDKVQDILESLYNDLKKLM